MLASWLMAMWNWAITISMSPICPPAPTVMSIGQLLEEITMGHGWSVEQCLKAYTHMHFSALGKLWKAGGGDLNAKALPQRSHHLWRLSLK